MASGGENQCATVGVYGTAGDIERAGCRASLVAFCCAENSVLNIVAVDYTAFKCSRSNVFIHPQAIVNIGACVDIYVFQRDVCIIHIHAAVYRQILKDHTAAVCFIVIRTDGKCIVRFCFSSNKIKCAVLDHSTIAAVTNAGVEATDCFAVQIKRNAVQNNVIVGAASMTAQIHICKQRDRLAALCRFYSFFKRCILGTSDLDNLGSLGFYAVRAVFVFNKFIAIG